MKFRYWCMAMAVAGAAFVPFAANADTIVNLPGSPNFNPSGNISGDFAGVTAETANIGSGVNGGSCSGAGGTGTCLQTTYGAGVITQFTNNLTNTNLWSGGITSGSNPTGSALGFVIYGIADASVVATSNAPQAGVTETVDNTGATATGGLIHIDIYSMSASNTPCFVTGCGANLVTASTVSAVTGTANSNVFNSATLFAAFTLESGVVPLNAADDGASNGKVTLTQTFNTGNSKGTGNLYAICNSGPGCSDFEAVPEGTIDTLGTGYSGDPAYTALLTQIFGELDTTAATAGEGTAGWGLTIKDPVFAVDVPEPASLALLGSGLTFLGVAVRRRRRKGASA